jgi:PAS domain S-box-containing protein
MTNVTEKKRLETALRDQHQLMQITLESIADAVITTDQRGQVEWMNTVASQLTGWKLDEARGYPIETVFHIVYEESRRPAPCPVRLALEHKNTSTLVPFSVLIGKDGTERGIEDSAAPIRDGNGNIVCGGCTGISRRFGAAPIGHRSPLSSHHRHLNGLAEPFRI